MITKASVGAFTVLLAAGGLLVSVQPAASSVTPAASVGANAAVPPGPDADRQGSGMNDEGGRPPLPDAVATTGRSRAQVPAPPEVG